LSHGSELPSRDQIKKALSNPKFQDSFIDMLDDLENMISKKTQAPFCPPGLPPQFCNQFITGGIPRIEY
jgi:hypothetical protein